MQYLHNNKTIASFFSTLKKKNTFGTRVRIWITYIVVIKTSMQLPVILYKAKIQSFTQKLFKSAGAGIVFKKSHEKKKCDNDLSVKRS